MNSSWKNIALSVLDTTNVEDITSERIAAKMEEYPYFSALSFLNTLLLKNKEDERANKAAAHTALFFQNPVWLNIQLKQANVEPVIVQKHLESAKQETSSSTKVEELVFEPLHTVDYFASQGIKPPANNGKDQLTVKLKSFTEWLKTMKRVNPEDIKPTIGQNEEQEIREKAEHSNTVQEVYSETLAEVYLQQGLAKKAIEVYEKLSLLDPAKSAYFASRITEIKRK